MSGHPCQRMTDASTAPLWSVTGDDSASVGVTRLDFGPTLFDGAHGAAFGVAMPIVGYSTNAP